jgi:hypothetical protein
MQGDAVTIPLDLRDAYRAGMLSAALQFTATAVKLAVECPDDCLSRPMLRAVIACAEKVLADDAREQFARLEGGRQNADH